MSPATSTNTSLDNTSPAAPAQPNAAPDRNVAAALDTVADLNTTRVPSLATTSASGSSATGVATPVSAPHSQLNPEYTTSVVNDGKPTDRSGGSPGRDGGPIAAGDIERLQQSNARARRALDNAQLENKKMQEDMREFDEAQRFRNQVFIKHLTALRRPGTPTSSRNTSASRSVGSTAHREALGRHTGVDTQSSLGPAGAVGAVAAAAVVVQQHSDPVAVPGNASASHGIENDSDVFVDLGADDIGNDIGGVSSSRIDGSGRIIRDDGSDSDAHHGGRPLDDDMDNVTDVYVDDDRDERILELSSLVEKLQVDLDVRGNVVRKLRSDNKRLQEELMKMQTMNQREEATTTKLVERIESLKKEKGDLLLRVEQEEEMITNNLQKKLQQLQREKVQMELALEQEQEFIVNRLQKQLAALRQQNHPLSVSTSGQGNGQISGGASLSSSVSSFRNAFHSPSSAFVEINPNAVSPGVVEILRAEVNGLKSRAKRMEHDYQETMRSFNDYYIKMKAEVISLRTRLGLPTVDIDNVYPPLVTTPYPDDTMARRSSVRSTSTSISSHTAMTSSSVGTGKGQTPQPKSNAHYPGGIGSSIHPPSIAGPQDDDVSSVMSTGNMSFLSSTGGIYGGGGSSMLSSTGSAVSRSDHVHMSQHSLSQTPHIGMLSPSSTIAGFDNTSQPTSPRPGRNATHATSASPPSSSARSSSYLSQYQAHQPHSGSHSKAPTAPVANLAQTSNITSSNSATKAKVDLEG